MQVVSKVLQYLAVAVLVGGAGYLAYTQAAPFLLPPCDKPLEYSIGAFDERFDISRPQLIAALKNAAVTWNTAAGKTVITVDPITEGGIGVNLIYGELQETSELGEVIDTEQSAFDRKKAQIENLKDDFSSAKRSYEVLAASFDRDAAKYHEDVAYWNAKGGAPPNEYERLEREQDALASRQAQLQERAEALNALAGRINEAVDELNALVKELNEKVHTYNENAGDEFDQGDYFKDASGARISVYEFTSTKDLTRVLMHEFGHALGIGHVENPDSIMYSYNFGADLELSVEDVAALRIACKLD